MSTESHRQLRKRLQEDVDKFLKDGGVIMVIEPNVSALDDTVDRITKELQGIKFSRARRTKVYGIYDIDAYLGLNQGKKEEGVDD